MAAGFGLTENQLDGIRMICKQHFAVNRVLVFGSRSMGHQREGSDLDVCLMDKDMPFSELLQLQVRIEELNLPIYCDVIRFSSIRNNELRDHIQRVGVEL